MSHRTTTALRLFTFMPVMMVSVGSAWAQLYGPETLICPECVLPRAADLEGDGDLDLLDDTTVYFNDGMGNFGAGQTYPGGLPYDMNGDGWLDLLGQGGWNRNNGAGYDAYEETGAYWEHILDLDGNGSLDLVHRIPGVNMPVLLYMNDGSGHFLVDTIPVVGSSVCFMPFDWDDDGDLDLMGGQGIELSLAVAISVNGNWGSLYTEVEVNDFFLYTYGYGGESKAVDVNADGFIDYVAGRLIFLKSSSGVYQGIDPLTLGDFEVVNIDCDPELEVVTTAFGTGSLIVADLTLEGIEEREVVIDPGQSYELSAMFPDLDDDGKADFLYKQNGLPGWYLRLNIAGPPAVSLDLPDEVLTEDTVLALSGGTPPGGFYTGPGVFDDVFYGPLAGTGPVQISYHYLDSLSTCSAIAVDMLQRGTLAGLVEPSGEDWSIFPNPCDDRLLISAPFDGTAKVTILDALGRIRSVQSNVLLNEGSPCAIRTTDLEEGSFVLQLEMAQGEVVRHLFLHRGGGQ